MLKVPSYRWLLQKQLSSTLELTKSDFLWLFFMWLDSLVSGANPVKNLFLQNLIRFKHSLKSYCMRAVCKFFFSFGWLFSEAWSTSWCLWSLWHLDHLDLYDILTFLATVIKIWPESSKDIEMKQGRQSVLCIQPSIE